MGLPSCACVAKHRPMRVVLTGGPGAGKTAVLELMRHAVCHHVKILPEAASILFGGGFPRFPSTTGRQAAQRAILHTQYELECAYESEDAAVLLCDRGMIDGLAYWPGDPDELLRAAHLTRAELLARYDVVIHLRTPTQSEGYNHRNPLRVETQVEAGMIDAAIARAWEGHPRRFFVQSQPDFLAKARAAVALLWPVIPVCCRTSVPSADDKAA